jgi:hypothetical protein
MTDVALKPSEVLAKAADLIEPKGCWTQHILARKGRKIFATGLGNDWKQADCFCVSGALIVASGEDADWVDNKAREFLRGVIRSPEIQWNDTPGRTQAEVVAALRKASELARSEGQ